MYKAYKYEGSVVNFARCIQEKWTEYTYAPSPQRARCNLAFRFQKEHGLLPHAKIYLPGELTLFENDKIDDGEQLSFL